MKDILERAAQNVAARKKQQEEARAKLAQAPSSSGFKNAVQEALQRKQEAQARAEALRHLIGQKSQAAPSKPANLLGRRMAAAIEREGRLPEGTRWLNQGDKAVVVRDFAHKPLAGVESAPRANAGMNAEKDYLEAVGRANEAFVAPVDRYGTTYGSMHDAYTKGKNAVERGETDPEYAAYHARMGEMLAEGDRLHEEAEALRPEWMQDETLRAAYEGGAQATAGGWDKRNYYDENPGMQRKLFDDYDKASAQREQLAAQIRQLEAAGMGNTPNLSKMREQLAGMDEQLTQMEYTKMDWGEDFLSVLENGRQNGWNNADSELLQTVLNPDAAIQRAAETHAGTGQIPIPKEADRASWMNDRERNRFLYLWQTKGEEAAAEYFDSLEYTLTQRKATGLQQRAYDTANSGALGAVGMTALDILATPVKGLGTLSTGINALLGKKTDPYGDAFLANHMGSGAVAGAKDLAVSPFLGEGGKETLASKIAGIGFDALQSGANSLGNAAVYGPLALVSMGLASSGDTTVDSLIRSGGQSGMSALNGIITGAGEILTEAIPMEQIGDMLAGKTKGIGSVLLHSLTEAPGEMLSTMIGEVSDRSVMGAYSGYQQAINAGVSPETATREFWNEVAYSGLLGWLSAAGSGVTAQTIGKLSQPRQQEAPSQLQQGIDRFRARQNAPVAAQNGQQTTSARAGEETVGSAADRLEAAAQAVAEAEQKAAEEAKPVQFAKPAEAAEGSSQSGSTFAQPMAAQTVDGENVQVLAIEQTADGKPYLRVADESGAERNEPIEAVAFADEDVQDLLSADGVRGLDGKALTGYLAAYDRSVPAEAYAEAYGYVYRRGAANTPFDAAINDTVKQFLSSEAQVAAYTAGLEQYRQREGIAESEQPVAAEAAVEQPVVQNPFERPVKAREELYAIPAEFAEPVKQRGGVVRSFTEAGWRSMSREQRRAATMQIELMDAMGRRFGRQIKVVDSIQTPDGQNINGRYNMQTGEIEISLKADAGAYSYVAMHELTHAIKNEKGNSWATFSGAVTDALMEQGQDVDALIQYQMDRFGYNAETALEEVVCNTAPAMLQNKEVLLDLYHKDRTLFERVRDWVRQMIADIQEAGKTLAARSQSWAQMDALAEYRDTAKQLLSMMDEIFRADGESVAEMQPQDGDDVWSKSMSDYDANANAAEVALGGMMEMTNSHVITSAEADTVARRAIASVGSTVDMSELAQDIWDAFAVAGRMGGADLYAEMMPIAKRVLDNSARKDKAHDAETAELRDMLKSVTIALTPAQKEMAAEISGSYVAYKRAARGLRMSLTRGTSLDTLYRRLTAYDAAAYPAGATDQQKLEALLSASDSVQTVYLTGMQENESIRWMADKMINSYYSLESVQRDVKPFVPEELRKGTEAPTDFAMMLRRYRNAIGAYEKTSHALFDEALHNVMERYGRKVTAGEPYDIAKETATDEGKALYRRVLSEQRFAWRQRMEEGQRRMTAVEQIKRQTADLVKRLEDPSDKKHVQDHLRRAVSAFLSGLDLGGKTKVARNLSERIAVLATAMQNEARDSDSDIEYVFDPGMIEELQELARQIEELPSMADMTVEQLQVLRNAVAHVHHVVTNADMMLDETGKFRVSQLAAQTVEDLAGRKDVKYRTGLNKKIHDMLSIGQLDSFHFFDLLGESGKKLFAGLRKGLDRRITHEADAIEYANAAMDKLPKEQRKALQQELAKGKHAQRTTFQVSGGEVELTRGQIMNLYLTSKRKAAQLHLYGTKENRGRSGIRFGEDSKARSVAISSEDVQQITDTLTEEEKQLADTLQRYLATECAKWGNETSRRLFGYSKYEEADYWPMRVDSETVRRKSTEESEKSHGDNLYAIAHMGFTHKLTPRSFNALYMDDVFTVFSKHVAQVAAYNAFAPASLDIGRWYNAMDDGGGGVRRSLEVKFGSAAKEYIPRLLVDLNGSGDRSYNPGLTDKMFGYAKSGAVGRNLRVIIQQPTAIMRAGDMMGYQHIVSGMLDPRNPGDRTKLKEAVELAAKYSPIAKLKQMGFFETNIGSGLKTKMFDDRTAIDRVKDEGMWLAGKMDEMTFGMLWRACESETRKLHPELTEGSEEFYRTVGKRLSDVIDYTQVVDSPLHRSQLMRSNHFGARLATNFLAEPTKTYNMLVSNMRNYVANRKDPVAKKKFVRTLGVFAVTTVVNAMAQSLIDAIRSDEDEEWWRKFLTAFVGDYSDLGDKPLEKVVNAARQALLEGNVGGGLNVGNMIPYVKDVLSLLQGWDLKRTDMQSVEKLIQTGEQVYKLALGENTTSGWGWAKSLASSVDAVTGLGIGNALRDGYAVTNLLFESFGAESPIRMKTEDATSTMAYDNLYKALTSGNEADWRRLMSKMLAKGKSEKDIHSAMADRLAEDERIVEAYGYKANGNSREVDRIRREMVAELPGWMGEKRRMEIVDKAINSHAPKTTTTKTDGDLNSKLYTTNDIGVVLAGWAKGTHTKEDYDLIISELVGDSTAANPEKTVQTNAKSQAKAVYKAATAAERKRLGEIIKELFGLTDKDLQNWLGK